MAIITTQRSTVYAYDPQDDDVFVEIGWKAPAGDGKHARPVVLPLRPISEYAACVEWAREMADKMAHPIHVVPLNHGDVLNTARWEPYRNFIASMTDQEWGELRSIVVTSCAQIMRDCDEPEVRAEAYDQLVKLKVVQP